MVRNLFRTVFVINCPRSTANTCNTETELANCNNRPTVLPISISCSGSILRQWQQLKSVVTCWLPDKENLGLVL